MGEQLDLFGVLFEMKAVDKIRQEIAGLKELDYIHTRLCIVERGSKSNYVVKTDDFEKCFRDTNELLRFVELGSVHGWENVHGF